MSLTNVAQLRTDYTQAQLTEASVAANPHEQFARWFEQALAANVMEPSAMVLATAGANGEPNARIVLLKGVDTGFLFYTNYSSSKGSELTQNPRASLLFFWPELQRQVRVRGAVSRLSVEESTAYFTSRPRESQLGAWASEQSTIIDSRDVLERRYTEYEERFTAETTVPKPPTWGGYRLMAESVEFWQGRASRLHDRLLYEQHQGEWTIHRLSP